MFGFDTAIFNEGFDQMGHRGLRSLKKALNDVMLVGIARCAVWHLLLIHFLSAFWWWSFNMFFKPATTTSVIVEDHTNNKVEPLLTLFCAEYLGKLFLQLLKCGDNVNIIIRSLEITYRNFYCNQFISLCTGQKLDIQVFNGQVLDSQLIKRSTQYREFQNDKQRTLRMSYPSRST
jgi:hypothetical protein